MRKCTKCEINKEEKKEFYQWRVERNTFSTICRICRNEQTRKVAKSDKSRLNLKLYREINRESLRNYKRAYGKKNEEKIALQVHKNYLKNKEKFLQTSKRWRADNPDKYRKSYIKSMKKHSLKTPARKILAYNIEMGRLIVPKICEHCSREKKLDGHHTDYSKPLEVTWLCKECHGYEHRRFKSISCQ